MYHPRASTGIFWAKIRDRGPEFVTPQMCACTRFQGGLTELARFPPNNIITVANMAGPGAFERKLQSIFSRIQHDAIQGTHDSFSFDVCTVPI